GFGDHQRLAGGGRHVDEGSTPAVAPVRFQCRQRVVLIRTQFDHDQPREHSCEASVWLVRLVWLGWFGWVRLTATSSGARRRSSISSPTELAGLRQGGTGPLPFVASVGADVAVLFGSGLAGAAAFGSGFVGVAVSSGNTRETRFLSA